MPDRYDYEKFGDRLRTVWPFGCLSGGRLGDGRLAEVYQLIADVRAATLSRPSDTHALMQEAWWPDVFQELIS